jgi:hypothetical protein
MSNLDPSERQGNNKLGHNRWTNALEGMPYSLRFAKAKALLDLGRTWDEVRASTGLSTATISLIKKGEKEVNEAWVRNIKEEESKKLTVLSHVILDSIDSETINKASLRDRVVSFGVLHDKRQLLDGKVTSRIGIENDAPSEIDNEIERLEREIEGWKEGKIINTSTQESKVESIESQGD